MQIEHRSERERELIYEDVLIEQPKIYPKLNISMEKKIERLWHESEKHGWNFSQFVTTALEVLTILHHRNKLRSNGQVPKKIPHRKHALS
jgi:hypothetical protein